MIEKTILLNRKFFHQIMENNKIFCIRVKMFNTRTSFDVLLPQIFEQKLSRW